MSPLIFRDRTQMTCSCKESESPERGPNGYGVWWYDCHECGASQYNTGVIMPFMYQHFCGRCDPDNKNYRPVNF